MAICRMQAVRLGVALLISTVAFLSPAHAGLQTIDLSAGTDWSSTINGAIANSWAIGVPVTAEPGVVPATAPYGNLATTALSPSNMMWYCGTGSNCTFDSSGNALGTGVTRAFFGLSFDLKHSTDAGVFQLIADDFIELFVNGQFILDAILDQNKTSGGQPAPLTVDISNLNFYIAGGTTLSQGGVGGVIENVLRLGSNTFAMQAMDGFLSSDGTCSSGIAVDVPGGVFCQTNRAFEYAYLQGGLVSVPEPGTIALFGTALIGFGIIRRRYRHI